jgi:clan AA aspartic protease (TIGR02281 family)
MLRTQDGTAWYIKSYIAPASIKKSDVQNELAKLSAEFGENPRTFEMPQREGLPNAVIAVWGKIQLEPLDSNDVSVVASGGPHKGLLVSFLGDLQKSARAEVPIYRLAGGAGYLWAATFDEDGRGVLQSLAIDASQIGSPAAVATNDERAGQSRVRREVDAPILVSLESEGGTYKIPVLVNKAITLKFVVDSGASDVSIPADVVGTLLQTGTLQQSDFVGVQIYKLADGSTLPSARFRIRSMTVGDIVVENVTAGITPVEGSLLLGQSFLSRFKSWSMDNAKQALVLMR